MSCKGVEIIICICPSHRQLAVGGLNGSEWPFRYCSRVEDVIKVSDRGRNRKSIHDAACNDNLKGKKFVRQVRCVIAAVYFYLDVVRPDVTCLQRCSNYDF